MNVVRLVAGPLAAVGILGGVALGMAAGAEASPVEQTQQQAGQCVCDSASAVQMQENPQRRQKPPSQLSQMPPSREMPPPREASRPRQASPGGDPVVHREQQQHAREERSQKG